MQISTILKGAAAMAVLGFACTASAGNIPQYSFAQSETEFEFLEGATPVPVTYGEASEMVFPDRKTINAYTGKGFPIGFDFKYAGKVFNQFAINNNGCIMLGYDKVEFRGYCNLFFNEADRYATNSFYMGITPSIYGIKEGELSYKLEGTEGNHTLTVEFAHLGVNEPNPRGNAIYSLQIILSEKDGGVRFNFLEEESPYSTVGLICGIYGWSNADSKLVTTTGLGTPAVVSTETVATMLRRGSLLVWDADDILYEEHDEPYTYSFDFAPTGAPEFLCAAPTDLFVEQQGTNAVISCTRPEDAPATVIMVSEKPILEFPEQGVSYPVYNDKGELITKFGDSTLVYYSNDETPTATFPNLKASTRYYVKAFGVNGYPSYSTESSADLEFVSSHPAPYVIQATSAPHAINVRTMGDDAVVIAMTLDRMPNASLGTSGIFGYPEDDCAVGDMIDGGGEIIYIGEPGNFLYEKAEPNREVFFRAWSLRDGRVSKTYVNAAGVTNAEMPYEPQLELYTLNEVPLNWTSTNQSQSSTYQANFVPRLRGEKEDEPALGGISANSLTTFASPTLNFGAGAKLEFEWAMETARDYEGMEDQMVVLPDGNKPGEFGKGHKFRVYVQSRGGDTELFTTSEYTGTMMANPSEPDHYISGTSEFLPVSLTMPQGVTNGKITFAFSTEGFSILYLRNITVTNPTEVEGVASSVTEDVVEASHGSLSILSADGGLYNIYSVDGAVAGRLNLGAGEIGIVALPKGVYLVNGKKYFVL